MGAACTGLQFIEFRTHYHPDDATYIELGKWFGNCKQYPRIIDAFRAGLLLAPDSTELFYLLGLTLYTSGDPKAAIAPLQQSIQGMSHLRGSRHPRALQRTSLDLGQHCFCGS